MLTVIVRNEFSVNSSLGEYSGEHFPLFLWKFKLLENLGKY